VIMESAGQGTAERSAAFFDVDQTLIRGDTQEMEGRSLMLQERLDLRRLAEWARVFAAMAGHRVGALPLVRQNEAYILSLIHI